MTFFNRIKNLVSAIFGSWWLYYLLILFVVGSYIGDSGDTTVFHKVLTAGMSSLFCFIILLFALAVLRKQWLRDTFLCAIAVVLNVLIITDIFLLLKFGYAFDYYVYGIILASNPNEAMAFAKTYFGLSAFAIILTTIAGNLLIKKLIKSTISAYRKWYRGIALCALVLSAVFVSTSGLAILGRIEPLHFNEYTNVARYAKIMFFSPADFPIVRAIIQNGEAIKGTVQATPTDSTKYVVIIGESHSLFHSSVYGYKYLTEPHMTQLRDSAEMIAFSDCISGADGTRWAMQCIFSYARGYVDISNYNIIPQIFKEAGYFTAFYDNQNGGTLPVATYNDPKLTAQCLDIIYGNVTEYDGDFCKNIHFEHPRSLTFIKINGQHFLYHERIPKQYSCAFSPEMYNGFDSEKQKVLADYDNCLTYTDSIINSLIDSLRDDDACVIYFSDHGEELFELGDFSGHGSDRKSSQPKYQLRVPFYIWGSDAFRQKPVWEAISRARDLPITTDDFSHFLTHLAGISFPGLDLKRSFISESYDTVTPRSVHINYYYIDDKLIRN